MGFATLRAMRSSAIDVVIPIYGHRAMTERCLAALARQTVAHHTIVVDNASPDDSATAISNRFLEVEVVKLGANRGFAAACNAGIAHGSGEVVVLLNNDVIAPPTFLERLAAPLAEDLHLGSVASVLRRPDSLIDSAGLAVDPTLAGFPRLQGQPQRSASAMNPVLLGPAGAAGAYRRAALHAVGGLDEQIFFYSEDVDLALRLRAAGWSTTLATDARAEHLGSATAGRASPWQRRQGGLARGYLLRRYGVLRGRHAVRAIATEVIAAGGDLLLSGDLAALRGRLAGWRNGRGETTRKPPVDGVDALIGFLASLRLRTRSRAATI
jgi:N-acetylglucosaminyl-diphospho-decaprenol L-rhamnosyltransferase